ncbi:helix-turn-helix transcriptional regulator [Microbacterium memoriense]|uniref:Helix-turn-helix domain-containing protein n=1 Tax=Microbacterium memoriense TaxID=2978350 RepID=A0ABT2P7W1_9MICO|nr:helix-turn-helix domain-containing protein [Microbacterium memoriense]MCT9000795.1 helix-turn-helix domain-containing protein [Microbacterium memoriense]
MSTTPAPEWLTLRDTAERLSISEKSVRRWIADGRLKAVRIGPRLLRVDADSILAVAEPLTVA